MTIENLQKLLSKLIESGEKQPTDEVLFQNGYPQGKLEQVDYVTTKTPTRPDALVLCHDDGTW